MKKILPVILSILTVAIFLLMLLPASGINYIPYLIHEFFSPGGAGESKFIIGFDIVFGMLIFFFMYKISSRILNSKK